MKTNPPLFEIELPLAPSTNHLYATFRGRRVLSEEGENFKAEVGRILNNGFTHEFIPPKVDLCLEAIFYIPKSAFYKRDLDNFLKITIDSIFQYFKRQGSKVNDNRITNIICSKRRADPNDSEGYCELTISTISEAN